MRNLFFTLCTLLCFQIQAQDEPATGSDGTLSFAVVETVPVMVGCEGLKGNDNLKNCFQEKLMRYVTKNFVFPKEATKAKVGCKIYVQFVVERDKSISNVEIVRGATGAYKKGNKKEKVAAKLLDKEVIRVVKGLKITQPAVQRGKPVRMSFMLPVNCKP